MKQIMLTDEQARQIAEATEVVELRDVAGTLVCRVDPIDAHMLAMHRKRKQAGVVPTGVPATDVQRFLRLLESEWEQKGPFNVDRAHEILSQMNLREE